MADDEGTKIYERVTKMHDKLLDERDPTSRELSAAVLLALDALEMLFRPPTEEEVDASLNRIATGDELAHKVAGLLVQYRRGLFAIGNMQRSIDKWKELTAAVEEYEEAMQ